MVEVSAILLKVDWRIGYTCIIMSHSLAAHLHATYIGRLLTLLLVAIV